MSNDAAGPSPLCEVLGEATIFVPFGAPCLSQRGDLTFASVSPRVVPQNARLGLPDRGKAKGLLCTRCFAP
jgi:hypothetical protein